MFENDRAYALARVLRRDKERSYFPWLDTRIKLGSAAFRMTVSAEEGTSATPTAAADDLAFRLDNKIRSILNQLCIDPKRSA